MTRLRDRLERMKRSGGGEAAAERSDSGMPQVQSVNADSAFMLRETVYSADTRHGIYKLGELAEHAPVVDLAAKSYSADRALASHERLLFLDTETTGLGSGAGNVPFMIGIGFYEGGTFVVRQLLARHAGEEAAMLAYLRGLLPRFSHIVTYNGRTFDWPVLQSRFVLNRLELEDCYIQLDLLYMSRSLWRYSLESCRLGHVEEKKLGVARQSDIPGSLAPVLYFQYLAEGNADVLEGVFRHNELDILTLAALSIHMSRMLGGKLRLGELPPGELLRAGLWLDACGLAPLAEQAYAELLSRPLSARVPYAGQLAAVYKKKRRYDVALPLWEQAAASGRQSLRGLSADGIAPLVELAIYYEHQERRYDKALDYAEEALSRAEKRLSLRRSGNKERELIEQLEKRRARLLRKGGGARGGDWEYTLFS